MPNRRVNLRPSAIVLTHSHRDRRGLVDRALATVPVHRGRRAPHPQGGRVLVRGLTRTPAGFLEHRHPFELGGFRITPFLTDHSAFDACFVLVEADGPTGPFRPRVHPCRRRIGAGKAASGDLLGSQPKSGRTRVVRRSARRSARSRAIRIGRANRQPHTGKPIVDARPWAAHRLTTRVPRNCRVTLRWSSDLRVSSSGFTFWR